MRISEFKFYKTSIMFFAFIGCFVAVGSFIFGIYYKLENSEFFAVCLFGFICGVLICLFPIILAYKHLGYVIENDGVLKSYSLLNKELCTVDLQRSVYYALFPVKFMYSPTLKYIALSNEFFEFRQKSNPSLDKGFYGSYNSKKIIVFSVSDQTEALLEFAKWQSVN
ncbi:MAG: hypothetical protein IJL71_02110 [Oscillospiraceae bacterium]|nr:hypothetical protein [Oscillospiraceae bacterium]